MPSPIPITSAKEQPQAGTPVHLFVITFPDGYVFRAASVACTFQGQTYASRVLRENLMASTTFNAQGLDQIPSINIVFNNADSFMNQLDNDHGFLGATCLVAFAFVALAGSPASASTDYFVRGLFLVDSPSQVTDTEFTMTGTNRMNMQKVVLPPVIIQKTCPWNFPTAPDQLGDAAGLNRNSIFQYCGYSPHVTGSLVDSSGLGVGVGGSIGSGYAKGDVIYLQGGTGPGSASFNVQSVNGSGGIIGLVLLTAGYGYSAPTVYNFSGGTGTGATLQPNVGNGRGILNAASQQSITGQTAGTTTTLQVGSTPWVSGQQMLTVSGYTGGWAGANGTFAATFVDGTHFSIAVNSSGFGSVTGSPVITLPFTSCNLTSGDCVARGMFSSDGVTGPPYGQITSRFGGCEFVPPVEWVRPFGQRWGDSPVNPAEYGSFLPLAYGGAGGFPDNPTGGVWVTPVVVASRNDGNLTRIDAVICMGQAESIQQVVVNGAVIPPGTNYPSGNPIPNSQPNTTGYWNIPAGVLGTPGGWPQGWFDIQNYPIQLPSGGLCTGGGKWPGGNITDLNPKCFLPATFTTYDSNGYPLSTTTGPSNDADDPEGSMVKISVVVPTSVASGAVGNTPTLQVLISGRMIESFDQYGNSLGWAFSTVDTGFNYPRGQNPAWVLLDVLKSWGRWNQAQIDLPSWYQAALVCDTPITVTNEYNGAQVQRPRFYISLTIAQRMLGADVVNGIRNCMRGYFTYSPLGLLQLNIEQSLANQQPTLPLGSNAIATVDGGYPAYVFSDQTPTIVRNDDQSSSLQTNSRSIPDTPSVVSFPYQNEFDTASGPLVGGGLMDQLNDVDVAYQVLVGQPISTTVPVLGIPNTWQGALIGNWQLNKAIAGNTFVQIRTSVRGAQLQVGQIIVVTYARENWTLQPFRLLKIQPEPNSRRLVLTAQIHDDAWYTDSTAGVPIIRVGGHTLPPRLPYPVVGDTANLNTVAPPGPMDAGDLDYGVATEVAIPNSSGFVSEVNVTVHPHGGGLVLSTGTSIPQLGLQPTTATTGGHLAGNQTLFYCVAAVDTVGNASLPSWAAQVTIPAGPNTNTVTLGGIQYDGQAASLIVYRGRSPQTLIGTAVALSAVSGGHWTDTGSAAFQQRPIDPFLDHVNLMGRVVANDPGGTLPGTFRGTRAVDANNPGPVLANIQSGTTIGNSYLAMTTNAHQNYTVEIVSGTGMGQRRTVSLNGATTLTLSTAWTVNPDNTSIFILHNRVTSASGLTITDSHASFDTSGTLTNQIVRITTGTGAGQENRIASNTGTAITVLSAWGVEPDTTSTFTLAQSMWAYVSAQPSSNTTPNPGYSALDYAGTMELPNLFGLVVDFVARASDSGDDMDVYALDKVARYAVQGNNSVPANVTGQSVSETKTFDAANNPLSQLTFAFTPPSPLGQFTACEMWILGFKGDWTTPHWLVEMQTSPGTFTLPPTTAVLTAAITNSQTSIPVLNSQGIAIGTGGLNDVLQFDNEQVQVTGAPDATHLTVVRGYNGTTAAIHASGAIGGEVVQIYFVSNNRGIGAAILTSPHTPLTGAGVVILNGQDTNPIAPSGLSEQNSGINGQQIVLSWSPNLEKDIDHYNVALRFDGSAATVGDIIGAVTANSTNANKLQFTDTPGGHTGSVGYTTTATAKYYVQAVDSSGLASTFAAFSAATVYAPDGSTDTGVPMGTPGAAYTLYNYATIPTSGYINIYVNSGAYSGGSGFSNLNGVTTIVFTVSYTGGDGLGTKVFTFWDNAVAPSGLNIKAWNLLLPNAVPTQINVQFQNYFGQGTPVSITTFSFVSTGSLVQDGAPSGTNFSPSVQVYGASKVTGNTATNVRNAAYGSDIWQEQNPVQFAATGAYLEVAGYSVAKGDLLTNDGSSNAVVVATGGSGNDGKVLTADHTQTGGFKWATGGGSVTSVALTGPTGTSVSGSPVTGSGTLALSWASNYFPTLKVFDTNLPLVANTGVLVGINAVTIPANTFTQGSFLRCVSALRVPSPTATCAVYVNDTSSNLATAVSAAITTGANIYVTVDAYCMGGSLFLNINFWWGAGNVYTGVAGSYALVQSFVFSDPITISTLTNAASGNTQGWGMVATVT